MPHAPRTWQPLLASPSLWRLDDALEGNHRDALLDRLDHEIPWETPTLTLYGRRHPIPRAQCWMGDAEARYRYSGTHFSPAPWHPAVLTLRDQVASLVSRQLPGTTFNSVLLNRYRDGRQRMGWHTDDEPELGPDPVIAAISLGAERPLRFRWRCRSHAPFNVAQPHGSLLLMGPGVQARLQHALLPRATSGLRISLTFRHVLPTTT